MGGVRGGLSLVLGGAGVGVVGTTGGGATTEVGDFGVTEDSGGLPLSSTHAAMPPSTSAPIPRPARAFCPLPDRDLSSSSGGTAPVRPAMTAVPGGWACGRPEFA